MFQARIPQIDELTGESILEFDDKNKSLKNGIKAIFDQVDYSSLR
tara:strand:+ start:395 stop:529 length:135 start_codon:yes stop_codon:yes gene_type:complete